MPGTKKKKKAALLPIWAYVLMNMLFLLFLVSAYQGAEWLAAQKTHNYRLAGYFPVLLVCYVAFTIVCLFDAAYERVSLPKKSKPKVDHSGAASKDGAAKG